MSIIIEFCTNNSYFGTDKVLSTLEDRFDCQVVEYGCLTSCGQCYLMPFAYVDGDWVEAPTAEELLEVIVQKLESFQDDEGKS
ncbi:YuzB family protein [Paenibacillus solani]|uniref:UDP-N-acetylmuramoylalanine--D-glutamate ligase n=1 Tax=Paenibacillus solani TaxID=1705565 RepID=A0A0M1NL31_9BACL|nr:YuzB family protein [Paenibacillus solani]KOR82599.1 UDP-N-acetylmuramoylalanine--D-glutamate ligase [Paenibacillus solani]